MDVTELKTTPGTRLGLFVTERDAWLFAPRAGKLDPRKEEGLSAVMLNANREAARALAERILGRTCPFPQSETDPGEPYHEHQQERGVHGDCESRAKGGTITKKDVENAEQAIEEHPPHDYAKEHEIMVYSAFVGYIEMSLVGASRAEGPRLKIPNELVERGLGESEVRKRINESVRIDLEDEVDTSVREINARVKAIRLLYTRSLGEPHGRIYRKRQRKELDGHLNDLKREIAKANSELGEKIETAFKRRIDDLAETYSSQTAQGELPELNKETISRLLHKAWTRRGAVRRGEIKLEVTFKDLTWETLQDEALRHRIIDQFPDLEQSMLYREYRAHTPNVESST